MSRIAWSRTRVAVAICGVALVVLAGCGNSSSTTSTTVTKTLSPSATVLDATYAGSIGFPKTVQAAKKAPESGEKGCTSSVEAVYENTGSKTGLISSALECDSKASASAALAMARKGVTLDPSLPVPKELGTTAFATDSHAPEYLLAWQSGNRVAITVFDVNIDASSTSPSSQSPALTPAQSTTLGKAAVQQNSLYS